MGDATMCSVEGRGAASVRRTVRRHGWRRSSAQGWLERVRRTDAAPRPSPPTHDYAIAFAARKTGSNRPADLPVRARPDRVRWAASRCGVRSCAARAADHRHRGAARGTARERSRRPASAGCCDGCSRARSASRSARSTICGSARSRSSVQCSAPSRRRMRPRSVIASRNSRMSASRMMVFDRDHDRAGRGWTGTAVAGSVHRRSGSRLRSSPAPAATRQPSSDADQQHRCCEQQRSLTP